MYLVVIAWLYVVVMMAAAEALSSQGTLLGAAFTFVLYGVLPLSIVMYIGGWPGRRRLRLRSEAQPHAATADATPQERSDAAPADRPGKRKDD